jgi:hypothetical protein
MSSESIRSTLYVRQGTWLRATGEFAQGSQMPEGPERDTALMKGQTIGRPLMDDRALGAL